MRCVVFVLALMASTSSAFAQTPGPPAEPPAPAVAFLPRYDFHLAAQHLSVDDRRFTWDTNFGGEIDFVDFYYGRATFYANFQAVLGEEFRKFDPSHGNYIVGGQVTARLGGVEIGPQFHHESRHLSDRPKPFAVDWNMLGVVVRGAVSHGSSKVDATASVRGALVASYVDYKWESDTTLQLRHQLRPAIALVASSGVRLIGTDGSRARGTQVGFREEGGLRVTGTGAAIELILAVERRIDPYPLEFGTLTWFSAGFRLVSR